jgi:hypothetical protein
MDAIRKQLLDLTHARAWPAPFKRAIRQADNQRERENQPKKRNNN